MTWLIWLLIKTSVVLAQLGLKAAALAWPEVASAFSNPRPGQSRQTWLSFGLAWPKPRLLYVKCIYNFLVCTGELLETIHMFFSLIPLVQYVLTQVVLRWRASSIL